MSSTTLPKLLFLLLAFGLCALGQPSSNPILFVNTAPSGACAAGGPLQYVISGGDAGKLYGCDGTWKLLATVAGGGGAPGGSTTQIQYNNAGAFGGMSGSVWTDSTRLLKLLDSNGNNIFNFRADPAGDPSCGGILYVNCDAASPPSVTGATGTTGGLIELDAVEGGNTSIATTGTGGTGGSVTLVGGRGGIAGSATTASNGGTGGEAKVAAGSGAVASVTNSTNTGGHGADATLSSGLGGPSGGGGTAVNIGGNAGNVKLIAFGGGSSSGGAMNTGGDAGHIYALLNTGGTGNTANGAPGEFKVNAANGDTVGTDVFTVSRVGLAKSTLYGTMTNCADSAGAAACGAAPAGSFVIDAGSTSTVVSTTAVTANSEIFVEYDSSLGTRLGVTCNTNRATAAFISVTARTAATSFTVTISGTLAVNPGCFSYHIVN